jgi:hypothetical protein
VARQQVDAVTDRPMGATGDSFLGTKGDELPVAVRR